MGLYYDSLQTAFRDGGAGHAACTVAKKIVSPLLQAGYIMFFQRDLLNYSRKPSKASSIRLTTLDKQDCALLAFSRADNPQVVQRAMERFSKGDKCFVALSETDEIAHSRWVSTNNTYIPELQMNTRPGPKQAYMYDGYTKPEYRGKGVDGAIRNFIFDTMKDLGCESVYSYVRSDNPVGLRAAERWQNPLGKVWYLQLREGAPLVFGLRQRALPALL
jgi:GNAT superfamily N-acetyltransferase